MHMRPDAAPLRPDELIRLRRLLRGGVLDKQLEAAEVAAQLGLDRRTVLNLVRAGAFPGAWKPAENRVRIPITAVEDYIRAHAVQSEEAAA